MNKEKTESPNDRQTQCPDNNVLMLTLQSTETVSPELAAHIDTCIDCQKELDQLTSGSKLLEYGQ